MAELTTNNNTEEIIQASVTAKSQLTERWAALQEAWSRLKERIERLFSLYEEQENNQDDNATQIRERDQEIQRLKNEIRETIDQISVLNPQLQTMEDEMDDITRRQFPGDREQSTRMEAEDVRGAEADDGGLGAAAEVRPPPNTTRVRSDTSNDVPRWKVGGGGLTGGYRYKTPKNRRKSKSKTKTKSKSPSKSKKTKKSRRKSKY